MLGWSLSCLFSFSKLHPIGKLVVMYFVLVISILPVFIIFLMDFGDVRTVWYFWRCLDSVVLLEMSGQCGTFFLVFHFIAALQHSTQDGHSC
jgi:hypothetical protein